MNEPPLQIADGWSRLPLKTMTLPPATTTNALLIGQRQFIVLDPGAVNPTEQGRLHDAVDARLDAGDAIVGIFLTHHHPDHVAGVDALVRHLARLGGTAAPVIAHPETFERITLPPGTPTLPCHDEQTLALGEAHLMALFTPGHAPGHLALWEPSSGVLAAGDMVATEGTIIVAPPNGDMTHYLGSLRRLRNLDGLKLIIPAHGAPVDSPRRLLDHYITHRLKREAMTLNALTPLPRPLENLVPLAYPELSPALYPLATQSLLAHLIKLESEGTALRDENHRWRAA